MYQLNHTTINSKHVANDSEARNGEIMPNVHVYYRQCQTVQFLRATAVLAGTAERVLAMVILSVRPSVRPSWCHDPVPNQAQVR